MSKDPLGPVAATLKRGLSTQPEYAKALGLLAAEWADLEYDLFEAFKKLSGMQPAVARVIFYNTTNNRQRIKYTRELAAKVLGPKSAEFAAINTALSNIERSSNKRNSYFHDSWAVGNEEGDPTEIVMQFQFTNPERKKDLQEIHLRDLEQTTRTIHSRRSDLSSEIAKIERTIQKRLEELAKQPGTMVQFSPRRPEGQKKKGRGRRP